MTNEDVSYAKIEERMAKARRLMETADKMTRLADMAAEQASSFATNPESRRLLIAHTRQLDRAAFEELEIARMALESAEHALESRKAVRRYFAILLGNESKKDGTP